MADLLEEQTIPISAQLVRNNKPEVVLTSPASSSESTTRVLATKVREPRPRHEPENFDTAPETFDEFDSALEEQPLGRSSRPVGVKERRLSTQALFNNNSSNALDLSYLELDLPEPEGVGNRLWAMTLMRATMMTINLKIIATKLDRE